MHFYSVNVTLAGILASTLNVVFFPAGKTSAAGRFSGWGGGVSFMGMTSEGHANFHFPLEKMRGWEARFIIESGSVGFGGGAIQLWAMDGQKIGDIAFVGSGLSINVSAGQGRFR